MRSLLGKVDDTELQEHGLQQAASKALQADGARRDDMQ